MSIIGSNILAGASGQGGAYQISRSVRTRASVTAYFNRTPASAGNRTTFTWSGWVKRGGLTGNQNIFGPYTNSTGSGTYGVLRFVDGNLAAFDYTNGTINWQLATTAVYRDPSAWYHIVFAVDTNQATASNRLKIYINGVQVTDFTTATYPSINYQGQWNNALIHYISTTPVASQYFDGYLTEMNFIDGLQLTPSSFGSTNAATGVWQPIKYTGTYGTNGFYLNFSDNSSNTATTIGKDYSGNGNNWTPNNISVTAGVTYDSMLDVPTLYADGGNGRGNYPVMNPLVVTSYIYANGNLTLTNSVANWFNARATIPFGSTGKFYYEQVCTSGVNCWAGIGNENTLLSGNPAGSDANSYGYGNNGSKYFNSVATAYGSTFTTNDVISVAFDAATGSVWFAKNGTWQASGNPAAGTNYAFTGITGTMFPIGSSSGSGAPVAQVYNFGQSPFTYTPPTGFVALNTQNLPTPTISNGAAYMAATTYTGTGSSLTIANTVGSASFYPDFVWVKGRSGATDHALYDSVRATTKDLVSNTTAAETTQATGLTAFGSTGFTVGALAKMNTNAATYVGWQWLAGAGSSSSNTSGSITSTVNAGATQSFSVVTYTGNNVSGATVGHGLSVAPKMVILKGRSSGLYDWRVYHASLTAGYNLALNTIAAQATSLNGGYISAVSSATFTLTQAGAAVLDAVNGASPATYVAYCFSEVAGYSKFGSYTGNGSADGPFVYLGFRPRFIMIKRTDSAGDWYIYDSSRGTYNEDKAYLVPDDPVAENSSLAGHDFVSNGFKVRTAIASQNASGGTFIYMAFAENPFKNSLAR